MKLLQLTLLVLPSVYQPREDSFLMIKALKIKPGEKVLEIGTGSGIIAIHCAKAKADVIATDVNPNAIICAKLNSVLNKVKLKVLKSDLFSNVPRRLKFNKIIFNPPYLPSGKKDRFYDISWSGGETGVEITNKFLKQAKKHLKTHGEIYFIASSLAKLDKLITDYKIAARKKFGKETIFVAKALF
jgi:release factor glutamine methyltransferase